MKNTEIVNNGAKSMVMQPLFAAKTQKDRKKEQSLMRKNKHKNRSEDF